MFTNADFSTMLEGCLKNDTLSREIVKAVECIARPIVKSAKVYEPDDVIQNILFRFSNSWRRIDPNKNPLAFLKSIIRTEIFRNNRKSINRSRFLSYDPEIERFDSTQKLQTRKVCTVCR